MNSKAELICRDGVRYLKLSGRIDSSNSAETENELNRLLEENPEGAAVLDAEELSYISSAGLRVILRLRKKLKDLRIINVSPDVYEIFDMTGFTEMLPVEKAYRRVSVEGCELIGEGSNGAVYRLDPDTIIKVYNSADALSSIKKERELARKAFVLGIPTAIPYDVVKVGDSYGAVFELLNAKSISKILCKDPDRMEEVSVQYVELLKKIHSTEVRPDDMPDMKLTALKWAKDVRDWLQRDKWEKLCRLIEEVPDDLHMIHGDYHTKNVILQDGEAILIDMDTLCHGNPVFEFASIFNAYIGFYSGKPPISGPSFIGIDFSQGLEIWKRTLRLYFGTDDKAYLKDVERKASLIGYVRILRRTLRRCDINDPATVNAVEFYRNTIENLLDEVDTLIL